MVAQIMEQGSFCIKYMIRDKEARPKVLEKFGGSVLGIPWDTARDVISMKPVVNLSRKVLRIWDGPALKPKDVGQINDAVLTMRILYSQVYGIYDPLGLVWPVTIKYKLLLQELIT